MRSALDPRTIPPDPTRQRQSAGGIEGFRKLTGELSITFSPAGKSHASTAGGQEMVSRNPRAPHDDAKVTPTRRLRFVGIVSGPEQLP